MRELHRLREAVRNAIDDRRRQAVLVVGPAGIGKSRLIAEFLSSVDDHVDPLAELARLLELNDLYLTASTEDEKVTVTPELAEELEQRAQALGHPDFAAWVGTENYEMRVAADGSWVDERVLDILRSTGTEEVDR